MRIRILLAAILLSVSAVAQERVDLSAPIVKTATTTCALDLLTLDPDLAISANSRVSVLLTCNNGDSIEKIYNRDTAPTGATLLTQLNRANFSINSLIKAVYNRLIADGIITGTISGTAQ